MGCTIRYSDTIGEEIPAGTYKIYFGGSATSRVRVFQDADEASNTFNKGIFRQKCSRRSSKPPSSQLPGACWRTAARSSRSCRSSRPRSRPRSAKKSRKISGSWMRGSRRLMLASKPCIGILCSFRIYDWQKKEIPLRLKAAIH